MAAGCATNVGLQQRGSITIGQMRAVLHRILVGLPCGGLVVCVNARTVGTRAPVDGAWFVVDGDSGVSRG